MDVDNTKYEYVPETSSIEKEKDKFELALWYLCAVPNTSS